MKSSVFCIILACFALSCTWDAKSQAEAAIFTNPVSIKNGPDPFVTFYNGYYYYLHTEGGRIAIYKCAKLYDLEPSRALQTKVAYQGSNTRFVKDIWAPELHHLNDRWYIYSCAQPAGANGQQCIFVLESVNDDPMGNYLFKAGIYLDREAIDATVFTYNNQLYMVYSYYHQTQGQALYIAPMLNPWTLGGSSNQISAPVNNTPSYAWERRGWNVNEGPAVLQRNNKLYIVYSASGYSSGEYCLGMLTYIGGDVTQKSSWSKSSLPVFQKGNGQYSVGHCSFTQSPDGTETWMVYHGVNTQVFSDDPKGRTPRLKKITWVNDVPLFGTPDALSTQIPIPSEQAPASVIHSEAAPANMKAWSKKGMLLFEALNPASVKIVSLSGIIVARLNMEKEATIVLPPGIYIVESVSEGRIEKLKIINK